MLKVVEAPLAGHPDKVCDILVESLVDEYLRRDPLTRMDVQALGSNGIVMIGGVVDSRADFDAGEIARSVYKASGYGDAVEFFVNLDRPSEEVGKVMVKGGAQGTATVYGYATNETREMLPRSVVFANALARRIDDLRRSDARFAWLLPDGKVQLAMDGDAVLAVTIIASHTQDVSPSQVQAALLEDAVAPILGNVDDAKLFVNPSGAFTKGGFALNAGVSGRKVLADTYGGLLPHGGVALAGKDPLKPGRAGTYMARYAARSLVAKGVANNIFVTTVYTIGINEPLFLSARTGTGEDVTSLVNKRFDWRPEAIVEFLNLRRPMYAESATYGMFGRAGFPWEENADG